MLGIHLKNFFIAHVGGGDKSGFLKFVEFQAYAIGRFSEFFFQISEISGIAAIQKKLHQKFQSGFGRYEGFNH